MCVCVRVLKDRNGKPCLPATWEVWSQLQLQSGAWVEPLSIVIENDRRGQLSVAWTLSAVISALSVTGRPVRRRLGRAVARRSSSRGPLRAAHKSLILVELASLWGNCRGQARSAVVSCVTRSHDLWICDDLRLSSRSLRQTCCLLRAMT